MDNPHRHLIMTICNEVLPNIVRIYESKKMDRALDMDQFVRILEEKIELANKSLKMLPAEDRPAYREKIDATYAENIDRLRSKRTTFPVVSVHKIQEHCSTFNTS